MGFLHACSWHRRAWGVIPGGSGGSGGPDSPMKISANFIHFYPLKSQISLLFGMAPPPGGLLLSILPPKWAALTLTQCTQYCVPVAHLHIPHQIVTPTCFSVVFQVSSCSTHLLTARTIHPRGFLGQVAAPSQFCSLFVLFAFGSELPFA